MNYQIEKTDNNLNSIKQNFSLIIDEIKKTEDINFLNETLDKVKLAKEWAKIQNKVEEMYFDLLKIEIECFKKIYSLKAVKVLHPNKRNVCIFYGEMTDLEINNLLNSNKGKSAYTIYRDYKTDEDRAGWRNLGISTATNNIPENEKDFIDCNIDDATTKTRLEEIATYNESALSFILDCYASKGESFTIEQFADELLKDVDPASYPLTEMKEGIREVCRSAVRTAKTLFVKDKKTPRFITCTQKTKSDHKGEFIRIPFENATLPQFQEMIDLRKIQLQQDKDALNNLIEIYEILDEAQSLVSKNNKRSGKILIKEIMDLI